MGVVGVQDVCPYQIPNLVRNRQKQEVLVKIAFKIEHFKIYLERRLSAKITAERNFEDHEKNARHEYASHYHREEKVKKKFLFLLIFTTVNFHFETMERNKISRKKIKRFIENHPGFLKLHKSIRSNITTF